MQTLRVEGVEELVRAPRACCATRLQSSEMGDQVDVRLGYRMVVESIGSADRPSPDQVEVRAVCEPDVLHRGSSTLTMAASIRAAIGLRVAAISSSTDPGGSSDVLPNGYWPAARVRAILDATLVTELATIPSGLSPAERETIRRLVAAGRILDDVFQDQFHHQALRARDDLRALHETLGRGVRTLDLLELQDLSQGPIATSLDNERVAFLPVAGERPGKNLYPLGTQRAAIESFLDDHPDERANILHPYTVVRRSTKASLRRDLAVLRRHPGLALLHPALEPRWKAMLADPTRRAFYAVPYSIAWADPLMAVYTQLNGAADAIRAEDRDLSDFLRLRARDLLANDYEGGDATWIRGRFGRLDAVIGPYETYDDELFGVKGFYGMRILVRDEARSASLLSALAHLQAIEDALPIDRHKVARTDIPIGVFDALADFGHQRFLLVAAEILPNDADLLRKYGRKIVLSHNLITAPGLIARRQRKWQAVLAPVHRDDLTADGNFEQTLWHELGHYLGPEQQADGHPFKEALEDTADLLEELKAELLSCFAAARLRDLGHFDAQQVRGIQAAMLIGSLRPVRPSRAQTYETVWLMLANFFLERDVLTTHDGRLDIRYERIDEAIEAMLHDVLEIQLRGSRATAEAYIERYFTWDERHESIAAVVRGVEGHRFLKARNANLED